MHKASDIEKASACNFTKDPELTQNENFTPDVCSPSNLLEQKLLQWYDKNKYR